MENQTNNYVQQYRTQVMPYNQTQHEQKVRDGEPLPSAEKVAKRGNVIRGIGLVSDWF